jgi:hypothetical protein
LNPAPCPDRRSAIACPDMPALVLLILVRLELDLSLELFADLLTD